MSFLGIVYGDVFVQGHKPWRAHPENPGRVKRVLKAIVRHGFKTIAKWFKPVKSSKEDLYDVHAKGYVESIERLVSKAPAEIDPDTYVSPDSLDTALYAYGSARYYAVKAIEDKAHYFVLLRPPGHHVGKGGKAFNAPTQGFCIFNNIAGAAMHLINMGVEGILIFDFDAHHGNGTQEIFYRNNKVLYISIHQEPGTLYPFHSGYPEEIGEGRGRGYNINFPLPPMAGDDCVKMILDLLKDLIKYYDPEIILVSAGFDGYRADGLTELLLTSNSFYRFGELIRETNKPSLTVLEGGYTIGLENGVAAYLAGLIGRDNPVPEHEIKTVGSIASRAHSLVNRTKILISRYWRIK